MATLRIDQETLALLHAIKSIYLASGRTAPLTTLTREMARHYMTCYLRKDPDEYVGPLTEKRQWEYATQRKLPRGADPDELTPFEDAHPDHPYTRQHRALGETHIEPRPPLDPPTEEMPEPWGWQVYIRECSDETFNRFKNQLDADASELDRAEPYDPARRDEMWMPARPPWWDARFGDHGIHPARSDRLPPPADYANGNILDAYNIFKSRPLPPVGPAEPEPEDSE